MVKDRSKVLFNRFVSLYSKVYQPLGKYDKGGRWYPEDEEREECCEYVRSPSRSFPYSLLKHCRSQKHVKNVLRSVYGVEGIRDLPKLINKDDMMGKIARDVMLGVGDDN
jgi:hypothetical protein